MLDKTIFTDMFFIIKKIQDNVQGEPNVLYHDNSTTCRFLWNIKLIKTGMQ